MTVTHTATLAARRTRASGNKGFEAARKARLTQTSYGMGHKKLETSAVAGGPAV